MRSCILSLEVLWSEGEAERKPDDECAQVFSVNTNVCVYTIHVIVMTSFEVEQLRAVTLSGAMKEKFYVKGKCFPHSFRNISKVKTKL